MVLRLVAVAQEAEGQDHPIVLQQAFLAHLTLVVEEAADMQMVKTAAQEAQA
jgi:hypothetical protein